MKFSALFLATLTLVSAAPIFGETTRQESTEQAMSGVEGSLTNARQVQDTLNHQLKTNSAHSNQAMLNAFITGADSQIDNSIATVSDALAPFTGGISKVIGGYLLGPFVQSVTNGAEVFLANLVGGGADMVDAGMTAALTNNYSKLAEFAKKNNVDSSKLIHLSNEIMKTVGGNSKRSDQTDGNLSGIKGAITNAKETIDTLTNQVKNNKGHMNQAAINAAITGLDSQIDNLAATVSTGLNGVTLGLSGEIGNFLLGPFVQSVTNGAEVVISNVIGGSMDIVTDGTAKLFSNALSQLSELGTKFGVKSDKLEKLNAVQKKVADLEAPQKSSQMAKRASDADLSGANGAITNARQVQDTLNHQLKTNGAHSNQAMLNAFITGADSQIDNSIATASNALAPFTGGLSKAVGNFLLGPFVQSVTNGAEVFLANMVGGGADMVTNESLSVYSHALENLSKAASKYGVDEHVTKQLASAHERVTKLIPKSK